MRRLRPEDSLWWMSEDDAGSPATGESAGDTGGGDEGAPDESGAGETPGAPPLDVSALYEEQVARNRQLESSYDSLKNELSELKLQRAEAKRDPEVDDADLDPIERQIKALTQTITAMKSDMDEQKTARQNQAKASLQAGVERDTNAVIDDLVPKYAFLSNRPALVNRIRREVQNTIGAHVAARGAKHGLTGNDVKFLFDRAVNEQKAIENENPAYQTAAAEKQAALNKKAVDTPGGASPEPGDGTPKLSPDDDEYWTNKKSQLVSGFREITGG